ncbi:MAG TPA: hypothetical protein VMV10_03565 [Pirellulales bacterium]|nr:hypothetical protein [Pirellulales bacterium]
MRMSVFCLALSMVLQMPWASQAGENASFSTARTAEYATKTVGGWAICESTNFRFCCRGRTTASHATVAAAEALKSKLALKWLGEDAQADDIADWRPKCDVILHTSLASYLQAAPGGEQTIGSSLIEVERGQILTRRIDIRADRAGWFTGALGHELTHVVLADVFPNGNVPHWADEGMAVLADTQTKQSAHFRDLRIAQSSRSTLRLVELMALEGYPRPHQQAAFYGQSASIVRFLVERNTPERFVSFVRSAAKSGYEQALRDDYQINGIQELELRWARYVQREATRSNVAASE